MAGSQIDVSTQFRKDVNTFFLACHCVAHRMNLVALDVAKTPYCKVFSSEINILINYISSFSQMQ